MKKFKILLTTLTIFALGLGISSSVFAGYGIHNYNKVGVGSACYGYSNYYHSSLYHRSYVVAGGNYYYSNGSSNSWYGGGVWSKASTPILSCSTSMYFRYAIRYY